jgi:hypothetical protein
LTKITKVLWLLVILSFVIPNGAWAYSYGDPNKEEVAETFKDMVAKLNASPSNWTGAYDAYIVRKAEIASHFGETIALTLDKNFEVKNKDLVIANYKAILVMNLDRRFDYGKKDINDYSKAKLLLAKAKGTFDVLRPYVEANKPDQMSSLLTAFDKALEALGNPGLFSVGEKPVNPEEFSKQVDYIYQTVKPIFPYTAYKKEEPAAKKPESSTPDSGTNAKSGDTKQPTDGQNSIPTQEASAKSGNEKPAAGTSQSDAGSSEPAATPVEPAEPASTASSEPAGSEPANTAESSAASSISSKTSTESKPTAASGEAHAPMERSSKTNPIVSILVIGSVVLVGIGALLFARKKGFI